MQNLMLENPQYSLLHSTGMIASALWRLCSHIYQLPLIILGTGKTSSARVIAKQAVSSLYFGLFSISTSASILFS